jgi:ABC-type branched-subunit amino acid transport system substrate-binding protein
MNQNYYSIGGCLGPDAQTYVKRQADDEFYNYLKSGEYCYVLNSRQMGKSSLLIRTKNQLKQNGFLCVDVDISAIGTMVTSEQWYFSIAKNIVRRLKLPNFDLDTWWSDLSRVESGPSVYSSQHLLSQFFEKVVLDLTQQPIIIFFDEIDSTLSLNFKVYDFFGLLRHCYNQRAEHPKYNRLTFALLGVTTPSDLIQDKCLPPLNVGREIRLTGFQIEEAKPLLPGLSTEEYTARILLRQVLIWTGGQPFLTQKVCQLIASTQTEVSQGDEESWVKYLIEKEIIEKWRVNDEPIHLRTIDERLAAKEKDRVYLLGLYQEILQKGSIEFDGSLDEHIRLRLSGLVIEEKGRLKVYNSIYKKVFSLDWVKDELLKLRPPSYIEMIEAWESTKDKSYLLQNKELQKVWEWAAGKNLTKIDYNFLSASQQAENQKARSRSKQIRNIGFAFLNIALMILAGFFLGLLYGKQALVTQNLSFGDKILDKKLENNNNLEGAEAFKQKKYKKAISNFERSLKLQPNDPETRIYRNNAKFSNGKSYTIAVSVPLGTDRKTALETLRGVAQAQNEVNDRGGIKGIPLKVLIANDSLDDTSHQNFAVEIAEEFVKKSEISGVIGNISSDITRSTIKIFKDKNLVSISPTSTSTNLTDPQPLSPYFFRTVPNDAVAAKKLANYVKSKVWSKAAVVYNSGDGYSKSLMNSFAKFLPNQVPEKCKFDLKKTEFDAAKIVKKIRDSCKAQAIMFVPDSVRELNNMLQIAQVNSSSVKKLPLLGGDVMYSPKILEVGGKTTDGMVLALAWDIDTYPQSSFVKESRKLWKAEVNWITAMSYDAAQSLITAIKSQTNPTREGMQKALIDSKFLAPSASGSPIRFLSGDRKDPPTQLVQIQCQTSSCDFKPLKP